MSNNPIYESQLNRHEEQIRDIEGRLHSYDLGLRWCEEQIKKIAGDDYSPCVVIDNSVEKEYDKLKNDYNLLKESYKSLDDRYNRERENWSEKSDEFMKRITTLCNSIYDRSKEIDSLEKSVKSQSDVIDHLRSELDKCKEAYLRSQVDVDTFQRSYTAAKTENDRLTECLSNYAWRRVDNTQPLPFEDHELYLFVVDGYPTPVKGKYHDDSLSNISIIVDDGNGKGPQYKVFFFMDGVIRYWMPLPEMPDTAIK